MSVRPVCLSRRPTAKATCSSFAINRRLSLAAARTRAADIDLQPLVTEIRLHVASVNSVAGGGGSSRLVTHSPTCYMSLNRCVAGICCKSAPGSHSLDYKKFQNFFRTSRERTHLPGLSKSSKFYKHNSRTFQVLEILQTQFQHFPGGVGTLSARHWLTALS